MDATIRKHGEEEGLIRYQQYKENYKRNNNTSIEYYRYRGIPDDIAFEMISDIQIERNAKINSASKESLRVMLPIMLRIEDQYDCFIRYGRSEHFIKLSAKENEVSNQRVFFYDFCLKEYDIIIEYHGVRFHDDLDYDSTLEMCIEDFRENYNKDLFKKWVAESRGYRVFIVRSWKLTEDKLSLFDFLNQNGIHICKSMFF